MGSTRTKIEVNAIKANWSSEDNPL
jgi:hypothetical protein